MIECLQCQGLNEDGTAYCEHCGAAIPVSAPILAPNTGSALPPVSSPTTTEEELPAGSTISFVVSSLAGEIRVSFRGQELLCGRRDERMRIFPDIALDDPAASRRHLALFLDVGKLCVQDLESGNGTTLNTTPIASGVPVELHHGDVLKIGEHVTIRVEIS
jgi:pSer/pThr/pTyr-binding forkhead associated (FHA) protein